MRFDLRLHGTSEGKPCQADVSVYATSREQLQTEAAKAAESAPWHGLDADENWVPDGATIVVEHVELLHKPSSDH